MSWLTNKLRQLASEARLLVVVDGINHEQAACETVDHWTALLGELGSLPDTTVAAVQRVSDTLVDLTIRRDAECFHCFTTASKAERLLEEIHRRRDAATIYVGDGAHAALLERRLGARDTSVTTWRACGHDQAISVSELDQAQPILEMLYRLRRKTSPPVTCRHLNGSHERSNHVEA